MTDMLSEITDHLIRQSWQIAVLFALVAAACVTLRKASAHWRYLLWLIVLVKCLIPPLVTVPLGVLPRESATAAERIFRPPIAPMETVGRPGAAFETVEALPVAAELPAPQVAPEPAELAVPDLSPLQWAGVGWILGAAAFALYAATRGWAIQRRLKKTRRPASGQLQREAGELAVRLGMKRPPKVYLVDDYAQPFVWGLLRGAVYLPADFGRGASPDDRRGILTHELAHVVRWDAAINALQVIAGALFFFHPLVWWANRKIRREREKCCDEIAIAALSAAPKHYSSAIVDALITDRAAGRASPSLAVAGPVKNLEERIKTIMRPNKRFHRRPTWLAIVTVLIVAALTLPSALTLTPTARAKEPEGNAAAGGPGPAKATATLSSGQTVELAAVSKLHTPVKQWWAPDGTLLSEAPYGAKKEFDKQYHYEFVIRYEGPSDASDRWDVPAGRTSTNTGRPTDSEGKPIKNLRVSAIGFPADPETTTVRYGVASGEWETMARFDDPHRNRGFSQGWSGGGVVFNTPHEKEEVTFLSIATTVLEPAIRVIAIDKSARLVPSLGITGLGVTGMTSQTYKFRSRLENIERFEFQSRPYEWAEFRNVSLRPGRKTNVRVIGNTPGATVEIYPGVIRRYVGKRVSEFPAGVDLSTPEAAAASWNRAWATADTEGILELSSHGWTASQVEQFWKKRDRIYDKALLDSQVVEVLTYRDKLAKVITYLRFPPGKGRHPYSLRSFGLIDGKWKNLGEDRCPSVEAARDTFNRKKDRIWEHFQGQTSAL